MTNFWKIVLLKMLSGYLDTKVLMFDLTPSNIPEEEGAVYWNEDEGTITINLSNGVRLTIGTELYTRTVNKTGGPLSNGAVVYVDGAQGMRPTINLAVNNDYSKSRRTIGFLTHDAADNAKTFVTTHGEVHDIDTSAFTEGDCLWLSDTPGEYTNVRPAVGSYRVRLGMVLVSHATEGIICVNIHEDVYMFGDHENGHLTVFEDDGTPRFEGNATGWQDIDFPIIIRQTGPGIPTLVDVQDGLVLPQWAVNDTNMCEGQEFVHPWKEASEVSWHLHMITNGLDTEDRFVKFEIKWMAANVNDQLSTTFTQSVEYTIPANTPDKTHKLVSIYDWVPTGYRIAGHVYARLTRVASAGAAPSNEPWISMLQMHVECDTVFSRNKISK